jgi:hypothetical protein
MAKKSLTLIPMRARPYPHMRTRPVLILSRSLSLSLHLSLIGSRRPARSMRPAWPSTTSRRRGSPCWSTRRLWSPGHQRPADVLKLVPVREPPRDAGEGRGHRGRGGPAYRRQRQRMGLQEGGLRRLLQEDLPLLREMEESLRCVSPLPARC